MGMEWDQRPDVGQGIPFAPARQTAPGTFPAADRLRLSGRLFGVEVRCPYCGHYQHQHITGFGCMAMVNGRWCLCASMRAAA